MELPEKLSKTKTRKLNAVVREYSRRLGLKDPGDRFSTRQHIIRICNANVRIRAAVRPLGGKLTEEQCAAFLRYMVEHPIDDFVVHAEAAADRPAKKNPGEDRRKLKKARKLEFARRQKFYDSWEWKALRYKTLQRLGARCMCCGVTRADLDIEGRPVRIVVDHIKPIYKFWELRLDPLNLQVLCYDCNKGKGAWDETDFRT